MLKTIAGKYVFLVMVSANLAFAQNTYFGDLHCHSAYSLDAIGNLDTLYTKARNTAKLDFVCVADHDHSLTDSSWEAQKIIADKYNDPGNFVALIGYEWTSYPETKSGHRVVIYRNNRGKLLKSGPYPILKLFDEVKEQNGIINLAHPDHGPYDSDTIYRSDIQRNIEIFGNYNMRFEYYKNPQASPTQKEGRSVQNWLANGNIFGFLGVSDDHSGNPGRQGLTAVIADSLTRESLIDAIQKRHVYATTGPRIEIAFSCNNNMMGDILYKKVDSLFKFQFSVKSVSLLKRIEVIRNNEVILTYSPKGVDKYNAVFIEYGSKRSFYYIRVTQIDDHMAWSSPIYINLTTNSVLESTSDDSVPENINISPIYPNPFNNNVIIPLKVITSKPRQLITVNIFNVAGQKIAQPFNRELPTGEYAIRWDGKSSEGVYSNSGVFFYTISNGSQIKSGKMVLIK